MAVIGRSWGRSPIALAAALALVWILLAAVLLASCTGRLNATTPTPSSEMPTDFKVVYEWRAGSMPPPYHYEYSVTLGPGEQGKIDYWPNYPGMADTPMWTEPVTPTQSQLAGLYKMAVDNQLMRTNWPTVYPPPVGGAVDDARITASGKDYSIPSNAGPSTRPALDTFYHAVKAVAPYSVWDELEARRKQWAQDYQNTHK
jgi:hypothetical protein